MTVTRRFVGGITSGTRERLRHGWVHDRWRQVRAAREVRQTGRALDDVQTHLLFVGHARSGHSILGALLGAHPDAVISDELDALRYVRAGFSRAEVLALSIAVARDQAHGRQKAGRDGTVYTYDVPDWWQGRWRTLRVVGDSLAGRTVQALQQDPALLPTLDARMTPTHVRFLHVLRDPFDNISTMMIRGGRTFEGAAGRYFETCRALDEVRPRLGEDRVLELAHEDLIAEPANHLTQVCRFLDLDIPTGYLEACAGILYRSPSRSSSRVAWSPEMTRRVREGMDAHPFLGRYATSAPAGPEGPAGG